MMLKRIIVSFVVLICCVLYSPIVFSQTPAIEWQHCYGGPAGDYGFSIEPTKDGGFITAGLTETGGGDVEGYHGNPLISDIWVIKTDKDGNIEWNKCLGGLFVDLMFFTNGLKETADGGYIVAGTSASQNCEISGNHGGVDFWLVKLDSKGNITWNKCYGGSKNEYLNGLAIAPDGGYIVTGNTESSDGDLTGNHGDRDGWVIKISSSGLLEWQHNFGGSGEDEFYSIDVSKDGNYILAGFTSSNDGDISFNKGQRDNWVMKLNNKGDVIWNRTYGGSKHETAFSVKATPDGGCAVAGLTGSNDGDVSGNHQSLGVFADAWLTKLDINGSLQWQRCYGGTYNEIAYAVNLCADGGYVLTGSAESGDIDLTCHSDIEDAWIFKLSSTGVLQWQKSMGGSYYDHGHSIHELTDGSYIMAGYTCSPEINGYHPVTITNGTCADFWLVKLSAPGAPIPPPSVHIISSAATICSGRATLTASAKYAGTKYTYHWFKNGVEVGTNSSVFNASDFKTNDQIICTLRTGGKCEDVGYTEVSDTIILKGNPDIIQPTITISADNTFVCDCTPITFNASIKNGGSASIYKWIVNGTAIGNSNSVFASSTLVSGDVVTCIYSDQNACILNGPVTSNEITILVNGTVTPSVSISSLTNDICKGASVTFRATSVNAGNKPGYQWKINGLNVGNNSDSLVTSSLSNNDNINCILTTDPLYICSTVQTAVSNSIIVHVIDKVTPSVTIVSSADTICKGSLVTFTADSHDAGDSPFFQWQVNNIPAGTNSNMFGVSSLANGDSVKCILTADPGFACLTNAETLSNKIIVTVVSGVVPSVTISTSSNDVCKGTNILFDAISKNAGVSPGYHWLVNNIQTYEGSVFNSNNLNDGDSVVCKLIPGAGSCASVAVNSEAIYMQINPLPEIIINPSDTFINTGSTITITTQVIGNTASFEWQPKDKLENPFILSPTTIPLTADQIYTLKVTNLKGCVAEKIINIKVLYPFNMPNAFTPNGDGINDIFRIPPNVSLSLNEFSVYDRWGNKIFTTNDRSKGWNGSLKGSIATPGVYIYTIKGSNEKGPIVNNGSVLLIR